MILVCDRNLLRCVLSECALHRCIDYNADVSFCDRRTRDAALTAALSTRAGLRCQFCFADVIELV